MKKYFILLLLIGLGFFVNAQNLPTGADNTVSTNEDIDYNFVESDFGYNDIDLDGFFQIRVTITTSTGTLYLDGNTDGIVDGGEVIGNNTNILVTNFNNLKFKPAADASGANYDFFRFRVDDNNDGFSAATYRMQIDVTAVNDAPVVTTNTGITLNEAATEGIDQIELETTDVEQNANNLTYTVTSGPTHGALNLMSFTQQQINTGSVNYTHDGTETTSDAFNFTVDDGTGTATSSVTGTFNITINAVNDEPTAADNTLSCNENDLLIFSTANFNYDDEEDNAGNPNGPLTQIEVTTIPSDGILWVDADGDGTVNGGELALTAGQTVTSININNGFFKYMPNVNYNGADSYTFKVHDGLVFSAAAYTMNINVTAINTEPSFTIGADIVVNEDSGPFNFASWITNISAGAPDEDLAQDVRFRLADIDGTLFSVNPSVDPSANTSVGAATGDLTFTPALNATGTDALRVQLLDNGSNTSPNDNRSLWVWFNITINPINDAPTAADNSKNCQENNFVTFSEGDFGYNDIEGDAFDQLEITTAPANGVLWVDTDSDGTISGGEAALTDGSVVTISNMVSPDRLRFMPDPDENGSPYTTFDFRVYDGTDFSVLPAYTMTINVAPINSEPSFDKGADIVVNEDAGAQSFGAWATNIDDGDIELAQGLTFFLSTAQNALFSAQPAVDPATGNLTFTTALNANGIATVDIYLQDDGSSVAPNDNISPTQTFTITINPINDPIIEDQNNILTVDEGASGIITNLLLQYSDVADGTPTSSIVYTVTALPTHGTLYIGVTPIPLNGTFTQQQIDANSISYTNDGTDIFLVDAFNFDVTDGDVPVSSTFNINITQVNDNPYFTSSPIITGAEGALYTYNITAADNDNVGADLSFTDTSAPALPAWLVLTDNGNGTATLSGTPPNGSPASINICITVDDGEAPPGSSEQCWTLSLTNGVTVDAGADDTSCDDTYTLNGSQPPAGYYGVWTNPSGGATIANINQYNSLVTNLNRGDGIANQNSFRWTIYRNSDNTEVMWDEVTISNNAVTAQVIPPAGDVCGTSSTLNAVPLVWTEESGTWTVNGTPVPAPVIVSPNNNVSSVTGLNNNTNDFTWTVTKGSCSDTDILSLNRIEVYATAAADAEICSEPFTVYGNDPALLGGTGVWTVGAGGGVFANANNATTTVTGAHQDVTNTYIWTVTVNGCSAQSSVDVQNNTPSAAIITTSYPATVSCDGNATIAAVPADATDPNETGFWTSATAGVIIANANNATTAVSNLQEGANLFTWHITNGTCPEVTADVTINYYHPPTVDAGPDATICSDVYNLAATALEAGETGVWTQPTGSGIIVSPNSNTTEVTNIQRGINVFQWTVNHDICSSTDLVTITNMNVEAIISTSSPLISCTDPSPLVSANSAASQNIANPATTANGFWTVESGGGVITSPSSNLTTFSNLDEGNNNFIWHISNGVCTDADTINVINSIPTQAYAGLDTIICSTTLNNLNGNNYDSFREIGFWRVVAGAATITTPSLANTSVTNLDYYCTDWTPDWWNNVNTANVFEWVIQRGTCESTDQVTVLNGIPGVIDAGIDQTVCDNIVNLDALDEGSCAQEHWWEAIPTTGVVFYDPFDGTVDNTDFNAHVDPIQAGSTSFVWHKRNNYTDSQGNPIVCTLTDTVQINSLGMEEDVDAGQNKAICSTDWLLNATPPSSVIANSAFSANVTGQWSVTFGNGNFDDDTYYNTTVRNMGYYTNVYRWTITDHDNGCDMSDDVFIHNGLPSNAQTGPDREVCDDYAVISANNPDRADEQWWEMITGTGVITGSNCSNIFCTAQVNNMSPGVNTFVWHVTEEYPSGTEWVGPIVPYTAANQLVCELTDTLRITNNGVQIKARDTMYVCADTAQLIGQVPIAGETGQWLATSGTFATTGGLTSTLYNDIISGLTRGKNTLRWTISNGSCSDSEQLVVWDNLPAPNPNAGGDKIVCEDSTVLSSNLITRNNTWYNGAIITQEGYSTQEWSVHNGSGNFDNSSLTNTWVRNIGHGQNVYYWNAYFHFTDYVHEISPGVNTQTCSLYDSVIIINNSVDAAAGTNIDDVCGTEFLNSTVTLSATPPNTVIGESGVWSIVNSVGVIQTPTLFNTVVNSMDRGENEFRWTMSNSTCSDIDDVSVFVYMPSTSHAGADQVVCRDATTNITLTGNDPVFGNGTWSLVSGGGNINSTTNFTTTVNNLGLDQNIFRWSIIDNPSCPASIDEVMITNNYVTSDAGPDQDICIPTATLAANDPLTYFNGFEVPDGKWTIMQGVGLTFDDDTRYNAIVSNLDNTQTNILRWTVTKGFCSAFDDVSIENGFFTVSADVDQTVCDDWVILNGQQPVPGNETGIWATINGGGTFVNETLYNTQVNNLTQTPGNPNEFSWTLTKKYGAKCSSVDTVLIYNNKVISNAGAEQRICNDFTNLNGNIPVPIGATGNWTSDGASITTANSYSTEITNLNDGQNILTWTISRILNGVTCTDASQVNIFNDQPSPADIEADKEVCNNTSSLNVVTIPVIGSGYWTALDNLAVIDNSLAFNANVTGLNPGINTFSWTVTNQACNSVKNLVITNNQVVANAGLDKTTVCTDGAILSGNNPMLTQGTGVWMDLDATTALISNNTLYNASLSNLRQGDTHFRWTVSLGTCSKLDDVVITNNQITATAGFDKDICVDFYSPLDGNDVSGINGTGIWTSIGNTADITNNTVYNTSITNLDSGINTLRWTVTSDDEGCTDFDEVVINNNGVLSNAGVDFETCNSSINLSAVDPTIGVGVWTQTGGPVGAIIVNSTDRQSVVNGLSGGVYTFTWTVDNISCHATSNVTVTNSSPSVSNPTTPTIESCDGTGILQANAPVLGETGLWTGGAGSIILDDTANNTTVSGMPLGVNTYTWTLSKGTGITCTSSNSISITNNEVVATVGVDKTTLCNDFTTLTGNDPLLTQGTGVWTDQTGTTASFVDNTLYNTVVNNVQKGSTTFRWTVTQGTCPAFKEVVITNNQITAEAGLDQSTCNDFYNPLNATDVSLTGTGMWTTTGPGVFVVPSDYNTRIDGLQSGINTLKWTVTSTVEGCTDFDEVIINSDAVVSDAGADIETCGDINLSAVDPTIGSGTWTQTSGPAGAIIVNSTDRQTAVTGLTGGAYTFVWTVVNGVCSAADPVVITNSSPSVSNPTTPTIESCDGTGILQANAPVLGETGLWTGGAGSIILDDTANNTTVSGMPLGVNTYTWTLSKGTNVICPSSNSISITNNHVVADAGVDKVAENCTDYTVLYANDLSLTQGTGVWTDVTGASSTAIIVSPSSNVTQVTNLKQGVTNFLWTVTQGNCSISDNIDITNMLPDTALILTPNNSTTCSGSIILSAAPVSSSNGLWEQITGTGLFPNTSASNNITVNNLSEGTNVFRWTTSNTVGLTTCSDLTDINIINNKVIAEAGNSQQLCVDSTLLSAAIPTQGVGNWTGGGVGSIIDNTMANSTWVHNLPTGTNTFTWTVNLADCSDNDNVVISNLSVIASATDQIICADTVSLLASPPGLGESGEWSSFTLGVLFDNSTVYNTTAHNLVPGNNTFIWHLENAYCDDDANITINYIDPIADAGPFQDLCDDGAFLNAQNPSQGTHSGIGTWSLTTGSGSFVDINNPNTFVSGIGQGSNVYTWTVQENICSKESSVIINNNMPVVNAGTDITTCLDNVTLPASPEGVGENGYWEKIGGNGIVTNLTQYNSTVTNLSPGINTFRWTVVNATCSSSDEVTVYNNSITSINAGLDQDVCSSNVTLGALTPSSGETGKWDKVSGGAIFDNTAQFNTTVSNLSQGVNLLSWTISNGTCEKTDFVQITNNSPTTPITDPDQEICTSTYTISATSPGAGETGVWTNEFGAQGVILTPTSETTAVHSIGSGANTFRWTISNALCDAYDDIVITNNIISTSAGLDQSRCEDTTVLAANNPGLNNGYWELVNPISGPILDNSLQYNTVVRNLSSGSNTFKWTVTNGNCSAWDLVTISNNLPTIADAGLNQIVCDGNATLSANNPTVGFGVWTRLGGAGTIANPSHYNTDVTGLGSGGNTFRWEITQSNCNSYDDVLVMNELVFASAGQDEPICGDTYSELNGNQPSSNETGLWTVTGGSGVFANPTLYNTSVSGLSGGENRLTWTVYRGTCSNSDDVIIKDDTPSEPTVSSDQETCNNFIVISGNPPITGVGHWSVEAGSGIFDDTAANTTTVRQIGEDNTYRWTITKGLCSNFADVHIINNSVQALVGDTIRVCGGDAYLNGNEPGTGETGTWTVTAGAGILANGTKYNTAVSNLTVGLNKFRWTISNGNCPAYADLVVINNLYEASASVAGPTTICEDFADLNGNIPIQGSEGHWEVFAGRGIFDDSTNPSTRVTYLNKGQNTLRWFITKEGCTAYDSVSITNNMVVAKAGVDVITCGNDAELSANDLLDSETGLWTLVAGAGTILTPSNNETTVTGQSSGVNVFKWTVKGIVCRDEDNVQVNENSFNVEAGPTQTVCDTEATLTGENPSPGTGLWTTGSGVIINTSTSYITTVDGLHDNSPHTFRWTVKKNGCTAYDEVIVNNHLVHAYAGDDNTTCTSDITLHATQPVAGAGVWNFSQGSGTITTPSYNETTVTGLSLGQSILTWTVSHSNCTDADNVIVINNTVMATAGIPQAICDTFTYLSATPPQVGGYGHWDVIGGPGIIETESAYNTLVTNLQRGANTFRWTVYENGCNNGGSRVQVVNNSFDADAGLDQTLAPLDTDTYLNASLPNNTTGQWSVFAGSGDVLVDTSPNSYVSNMPTGENIFSWIVYNSDTGCSDDDQVSIIVANFEPYAGEDKIICEDSVQLNARVEAGATSHTWSIVSGGGAFDDVHDANTIVRNVNYGINVYKWTVTFVGYSASDNVIITNDSIFVSAGDDVATCATSYQMKGGRLIGADSTWWSPVGFGGGGVIENNSEWNSMITDLDPGNSYFEWYVSNGNCESRDTVKITYQLPPIAQFEASETEFCAPSTITLNNTSTAYGGQSQPDEFRWLLEDFALAPTYDVNTDIVHTFTNTAEWDSIYHIRLVAIDYETMCTDTFKRDLTAYAAPKVKFEIRPDQPLRIPDADFKFYNGSDSTLNEYQWDFGNGDNRLDLQYEGYFNYTYEIAGTYVVKLKGVSDGHCNAEYTDTLVVLPACPYSYDSGSKVSEGCEDLTVEFYNSIYYADEELNTKWYFYDENEDEIPDGINETNISTYDNDPIYEYTEPGIYHPYFIAWNDACGSENQPYFTRRDTVVVFTKPKVDFDVAPKLVMLPEQLLTCFNYSEYGERYYWDFGDETSGDNSLEFPQHLYSEPGIYDITLSVWTEHECFDQKTVKGAVTVEEEGNILFPDAFTPNLSGGNGGTYPCGEKYIVDKNNLNDVFYPKQSGVVSYSLEIYNRWGEKIFVSNELCKGWDGYVDGVLAPQDVYVWKVSVIYRNGKPDKKYGSVTLLR